jgi:hypothetical protein
MLASATARPQRSEDTFQGSVAIAESTYKAGASENSFHPLKREGKSSRRNPHTLFFAAT